MPAAAVIPAPIAYIKVVAVKKLVVGFQGGLMLLGFGSGDGHPFLPAECSSRGAQLVYCEKIRVFKAGFRCEYISME